MTLCVGYVWVSLLRITLFAPTSCNWFPSLRYYQWELWGWKSAELDPDRSPRPHRTWSWPCGHTFPVIVCNCYRTWKREIVSILYVYVFSSKCWCGSQSLHLSQSLTSDVRRVKGTSRNAANALSGKRTILLSTVTLGRWSVHVINSPFPHCFHCNAGIRRVNAGSLLPFMAAQVSGRCSRRMSCN